MTYNVFSGTLKPTQSTLLQSCVHNRVDPTSAAGQLDPIVATDPGMIRQLQYKPQTCTVAVYSLRFQVLSD